MSMTRRGFLKGILAAAVAPAIVRVESLMPLWTPPEFELPLNPLFAGEVGQFNGFVIHSEAARRWSRAIYHEASKARSMQRFMAGRQWGDEVSRFQGAPIILNTIPPFEHIIQPERDVAASSGPRSKGLLIHPSQALDLT